MKRIFYAGGSVVTGDRVADAVVEYARALALQPGSESISIPVLSSDGQMLDAILLIGPASELVVVPETTVEEKDDAVAAEALATRAAELRGERVQPRAVTSPAIDHEADNWADLVSESSESIESDSAH